MNAMPLSARFSLSAACSPWTDRPWFDTNGAELVGRHIFKTAPSSVDGALCQTPWEGHFLATPIVGKPEAASSICFRSSVHTINFCSIRDLMLSEVNAQGSGVALGSGIV